jgi:hypothetical protein
MYKKLLIYFGSMPVLPLLVPAGPDYYVLRIGNSNE